MAAQVYPNATKSQKISSSKLKDIRDLQQLHQLIPMCTGSKSRNGGKNRATPVSSKRSFTCDGSDVGVSPLKHQSQFQLCWLGRPTAQCGVLSHGVRMVEAFCCLNTFLTVANVEPAQFTDTANLACRLQACKS